MNLVPYDSELWTLYPGAYGNVCEIIKIVMGDIEDIPPQSKLRRLDLEEKDDYQIAYDNLWANLLHQMDFYEATYIVLPYIVKLLEKNEDDFDMSFSIISQVGLCLATDIPSFTKGLNKEVLSCYKEVHSNYEEAVSIIGQKTKDFIKNHLNEIKEIDSEEKWMFAISVMAILGDNKAALVLCMTDWDELDLYIKCNKCGYYDESSYLDDDEHFLNDITPAPTAQWDGINYDDTYTWFSGFVCDLEIEEAKYLPYLYGTYACPECGDRKAVIEFMKSYFPD